MDTKNNLRLIQVFVLVTGVFLSSLSGWLLYKAQNEAIINEFQKDVNEVAASLYREMALDFEALRSLATLFDGEIVPSSKQFSLRANKILIRHPDIQALEWIPRVVHAERATYESQLQRKHPGVEIVERQAQGQMVRAGERPEYFPVCYIEPLKENEAAFGFDLGSNPTRLNALKGSRDNAMPQISASVILVQEHQDQKGFLAVLPIYDGTPATVESRRNDLKGFVIGVYRVRDVFANSVLSAEPLNIEIQIVDETLLFAKDILHIHELPSGMGVHKGVEYRKELPVLWGRKWFLVAFPSMHYIAARRDILPVMTFSAGIIITFFVCLTVITSRRASTIQRIVSERTIALNEATKKLEMLSRIDGLSGIPNRRCFDEFLHKEWLRAFRNKSYISLILVDVDYFKLYNDNYGHARGDDCLRMVAQTLDRMVQRPGDLVARFGGEEFGLVLSDKESAEFMSNKCRQSIEGLQIPHEYSEAADVVTISVGFCAVVPGKGMDPSSIIDSADKALYQAKAQGRNRVVSASVS